MRIADCLQINKGVTSIIGGGGKTSLMLRLAQELSEDGTVIICTTTKILRPKDITLISPDSEELIEREISKINVICVSAGEDLAGKLMPPNTSVKRLKSLADYVLIEADGSKGLPLKAHAEHEPVIADESDQTILVIGIDGVGKKIDVVCHRSELYAQLADADVNDCVSVEMISRVILKENLGTKIYINKVETKEQMSMAKELSKFVNVPVIAGSLMKGEYECL